MGHHVEPGGPALEIDLGDGARAHKLSVGPMDNNTYLLTPTAGTSVLIDAAAEPGRILDLVTQVDPDQEHPVASVVTTHRHHDHVGALAEVAHALPAHCWAGRPDAEAITTATGVEQRALWTGDRVGLGEAHLEVIGLVGHTPGSIAVVWQPEEGPAHVFTGDSLFPGGVGRTRSPDDFASLLGDVTTHLFDRLPDATIVHPGHGDSTTLGAERPHLAEWRARGW